MAKGVYRMPDGRVVVDYGWRRVPISRAQYRANGYHPPYDKLALEPPEGATRDRKLQANAAASAMPACGAERARPMRASSPRSTAT
jgi:hypothetical protein